MFYITAWVLSWKLYPSCPFFNTKGIYILLVDLRIVCPIKTCSQLSTNSQCSGKVQNYVVCKRDVNQGIQIGTNWESIRTLFDSVVPSFKNLPKKAYCQKKSLKLNWILFLRISSCSPFGAINNYRNYPDFSKALQFFFNVMCFPLFRSVTVII